jgi:hypothetical protein
MSHPGAQRSPRTHAQETGWLNERASLGLGSRSPTILRCPARVSRRGLLVSGLATAGYIFREQDDDRLRGFQIVPNADVLELARYHVSARFEPDPAASRRSEYLAGRECAALALARAGAPSGPAGPGRAPGERGEALTERPCLGQNPACSAYALNNRADLDAALAHVKGRYKVVGKIKNYVDAPMESGYRDMTINLEAPNGHIVEMKLTFERMLEASWAGGGHKLYEARRSITGRAGAAHRALTPAERAEVDRLLAAERDLYEAAFKNQK